MIGSIVVKDNPVLTADLQYSRTFGRAYEGGPGFSNYSQRIRAMGGFWEAHFRLFATLEEIVEFQERGHGRHVEVYGERTAKVWEGLIVEMEADLDLEQNRLPTLDVVAWGYYRTLYWRTYNQTALTGNTEISSLIPLVLTASGQFIAGSVVETNPALVTKEYDADRLAGDILFDVAKASGATNERYTIAVYENRMLYYRRAAKATRPIGS